MNISSKTTLILNYFITFVLCINDLCITVIHGLDLIIA
ncbi:hypothetical protein HMPREF1214_00127 [Bacteroides sp. HPS0048]|nr:hypothetical protein HMPREF1214_00127 [Bacteroides sp. HPS0048]